ncbi:hypothetical protein QJ48_24880, partial [Paenibacillus sp. A3]|uniref:hypothetical protein n=1 Tax=Paenibacillus sp. A3 TaxID=1337054 RepID=UPI0006E4EF77
QYRFTGTHFETSQNTTTGGGFFTLSVTGQAPANAAYARVWLVLMGTDNNGSGTVYFDQTSLRYDPDGNMLANASFELKTGTSGLADGWYGNKDQGIAGEYEVVAHHASSGQRAQKITGSGLGLYNQINVFQDVKIEPGKTYTASSRIFVESLTNAKVNLTVDYLDAQYRFTGSHFETSQNITTGGGFLTLSVTGQAPANAAYARVWLVLMGTDNNGSGTVYFDQTSLRYDPDGNMLANANFELKTGTSGLADGWQGNMDQGITGEYEVVAHHASSGQRAQKITGSGLGLHNQINVFQDVKIDPGKTYTASSRIFVESLANAKVNLTVDYLDEQYRFTGAHFETSQNTTTGGGFSTLSVTGQAPANAAYARVWLVLMGTDNNGSGIVYWDAATLQAK